MRKTPVILVRSLKPEKGGITRASIKRANMLAKSYKQVVIITILYQQYSREEIKYLYDKKILEKNIKVINFFESFKGNKRKRSLLKKKDEKFQKYEKGYKVFKLSRNKEQAYRFYKNGLYEKYKRFNESNILKYIDYMDDSRQRIKREEYDLEGNLLRIRHMDKNVNRPSLDRYFDFNGNCYLSVHVNSKSNKEDYSVLFKGENEAFDTLYDLLQKWLERQLNFIKFPIVFCELRSLDKMLLDVKHTSIKKVAVVHANHLANPFDDIMKIEPAYNRLFKWIDGYDKIIVLTFEQKSDIEQVYDFKDKLIVIPHAHEPISIDSGNVSQEDYSSTRAVSLARYHSDKRIQEAIKAFRFVVNDIPHATYDIYGKGPLQSELQELITELNLEKNVFLKGFSSDPKKVFQSASCTILTSLREGFGMVITESMAEGTPVVSYKIKYGPKDIIENGVNGYLIENGDQKGLAEKIVNIMQNQSLRKNLSKNAMRVREKFSEKQYQNKWVDLIKRI